MPTHVVKLQGKHGQPGRPYYVEDPSEELTEGDRVEVEDKIWVVIGRELAPGRDGKLRHRSYLCAVDSGPS